MPGAKNVRSRHRRSFAAFLIIGGLPPVKFLARDFATNKSVLRISCLIRTSFDPEALDGPNSAFRTQANTLAFTGVVSQL